MFFLHRMNWNLGWWLLNLKPGARLNLRFGLDRGKMDIYHKSEGESRDYNAQEEENALVFYREFSEGIPAGFFALTLVAIP